MGSPWWNVVLNLIINGIPSIQDLYKISLDLIEVLNLVISGISSIPVEEDNISRWCNWVLNLVISGIPSILNLIDTIMIQKCTF